MCSFVAGCSFIASATSVSQNLNTSPNSSPIPNAPGKKNSLNIKKISFFAFLLCARLAYSPGNKG
jgi:hypothetical protein